MEQKIANRHMENVYVSTSFHRSIELVYVQKGTIKVQIGAEIDTVNENEIAFIPSFHAHHSTEFGRN